MCLEFEALIVPGASATERYIRSIGTHCCVIRDFEDQFPRAIGRLPPLHAVSCLIRPISSALHAETEKRTHGVRGLLIESLCRLLVLLPGGDVDHDGHRQAARTTRLSLRPMRVPVTVTLVP